MVIEEHMYCIIQISGDENTHAIGEKDIIDDDVSITSQCCDENTFSVGGVYSSQLSMTFRATFKTNVYDIRGAKIMVYTRYNTESYALRGTFWVTSATRYQDIFTVSASDSLIWLDNIPTSGEGVCDSLTYYLESFCRTPKLIGKCIVQATNAMVLGMDCSTKANLENSIASLNSSDMLFQWQHPDVLVNERTNFMLEDNSFRHWHNGEDGKFDVETSPREHLGNIAQLVGGFAYALPNGNITFGRFFSVKELDGDSPVEITTSEIERDSLDVSSSIISPSMVKENFAIVNRSAWTYRNDTSKGLYYKIVLEDNPFLDGYYAEMNVTDHNFEYRAYPITHSIYRILQLSSTFDTQNTEVNDTNFDAVQLNVANAPTQFTTECYIRPFKLTCHKPYWFKLGQQVRVPRDVNSLATGYISTVTKAVWTFKGGWELSCTGGDTRMLSETVKNSQAKKLQRAVLYKRQLA